MRSNLANILVTIKYFLLSMVLLSVLMSVMVCWIVFRVINAIPQNRGESLKVEEIQMLSNDVRKVYGECLSGIDWVKVVRGESKNKIEECMDLARKTDAYMRLKSTYGVLVLPDGI